MPHAADVERDQRFARWSYRSAIRMSNFKIQMTNQIQMIKCPNDSMKIHNQGIRVSSAVRWDGQSVCRKWYSLRKAGFHSGN